MPKPIALDTPCEVCGKNEWWDNRATKKTAKMPDYKCANKECKTESGYPNGRWLPKGQSKPAAPTEPQGGRLTGDDTTPDEKGQRLATWEAYTYTYSKLLGAVVKAFKANEVPVEASAVQAAVATLLIQADKAHLPLLHPRKAPPVQAPEPKKPTKPALPEAFDDFEEVDSAPLPF